MPEVVFKDKEQVAKCSAQLLDQALAPTRRWIAGQARQR